MPAYLLRMRNLRPALWCVSELSVARRGSWLAQARGEIGGKVSALPHMARGALDHCARGCLAEEKGGQVSCQ